MLIAGTHWSIWWELKEVPRMCHLKIPYSSNWNMDYNTCDDSMMKTCMKSLPQEQYSLSFPHPFREEYSHIKGNFSKTAAKWFIRSWRKFVEKDRWRLLRDGTRDWLRDSQWKIILRKLSRLVEYVKNADHTEQSSIVLVFQGKTSTWLYIAAYWTCENYLKK